MTLLPAWMRGYERAWLVRDLVAGLVVGSVVVPQAVAYAQIAGLPPSAGLAAAPGALLAYALLGTSRTLIVSATTATSAVSAAAVGPLANGDALRFAALSAALALVTAAVLVLAGALRLGGVMDLVSKPVMTGFLFGLGLTVTIGQLPKLFGVPAGSGKFFAQLRDLLENLDGTSWWTLATGAACVVALVAVSRLAPRLPAFLLVLAAAIVVSAALDLAGHGVEVVGDLPSAVPDPAVPDVGWRDLVDLLPAALGILIVSAEAIGVARAIAGQEGYRVDANRDLVALGGSNLLAGLSSGFVQSGGASQTMAADRAGGKTQLVALSAAGVVLLTGAFLTPLFEDLPQATLAAIVVVAISSFFRVGELRRFARLTRISLVLSLTALAGVLLLGVLPGLLVAAGLTLVILVQRLSRPPLAIEERDGVLHARAQGPLFYANAAVVREHLGDVAAGRVVVLDVSANDELDVETADMLADLAAALAGSGGALRLTGVRPRVRDLLERSGLRARMDD